MDKKYFLEKGIIYLEGNLDNEQSLKIISLLNRIDDENHDFISIYIALESSELSAAMMLCDVIRSLKTRVKTYSISCLGGYSSYVFLAGDERIALKHSVINFPRFEFDIFGSKNELINFNRYQDKIRKNLLDTYVLLTGNEAFPKFLTEDKFMKSEEMLKRNIATKIIGG